MQRGELVVYTAITGDTVDKLRIPKISTDACGRQVRFVCFSDDQKRAAPGWDCCSTVWNHPTVPRRTARYHKLNAHLVFPAATYSLWIDGSMQLLVNPWTLVDRFLSSVDVATFRHPHRSSVAQEAEACCRRKKDDCGVIQRHLQTFKDRAFPDNVGLFETGMLLRRHTQAVATLNASWWSELESGSFRDQLSLPYVVWRHATKVGLLEGSGTVNPYVRFFSHK